MEWIRRRIRERRRIKARRRYQKLREKIVLALLKSHNHTPNVSIVESSDSKHWAYTDESTINTARALIDFIKKPMTSWSTQKQVERYIRRQKDKDDSLNSCVNE
jgi:predicted class III extradiol MEMO1 family dioxygenase